MQGLLLSDDLIFTSRIVGTARDLGLEIGAARTLGDLQRRLDVVAPVCVILDLHHPDLKTFDAIPLLKARGLRVVGYGSHVAADVLHAARQAGCDVVWPRSKFVEELATAMPGWLNAREAK